VQCKKTNWSEKDRHIVADPGSRPEKQRGRIGERGTDQSPRRGYKQKLILRKYKITVKEINKNNRKREDEKKEKSLL